MYSRKYTSHLDLRKPSRQRYNEISAGILYPRGATLGGSSQVNAMNFAWAPDNEWDYIANLTGDQTWGHENMRKLLIELENCTYVPEGTPGHGYDGYLTVSMSSFSLGIVADAL
jgi:choline dehydrogenase